MQNDSWYACMPIFKYLFSPSTSQGTPPYEALEEMWTAEYGTKVGDPLQGLLFEGKSDWVSQEDDWILQRLAPLFPDPGRRKRGSDAAGCD